MRLETDYLCCLTAFSSYAQHVPTLEEVVNGGLIVTKGESQITFYAADGVYVLPVNVALS